MGGIWGKGGGEREGSEGSGGLLAKRQTGAAPLESLKWQTLKRASFFLVWGGRGGRGGVAAAAAARAEEEDENIPQDKQATEFLSFLDLDLCQFFFLPLFLGFSAFFCKFSGTVKHFLLDTFFRFSISPFIVCPSQDTSGPAEADSNSNELQQSKKKNTVTTTTMRSYFRGRRTTSSPPSLPALLVSSRYKTCACHSG